VILYNKTVILRKTHLLHHTANSWIIEETEEVVVNCFADFLQNRTCDSPYPLTMIGIIRHPLRSVVDVDQLLSNTILEICIACYRETKAQYFIRMEATDV
jgi:hypothetical protein